MVNAGKVKRAASFVSYIVCFVVATYSVVYVKSLLSVTTGLSFITVAVSAVGAFITFAAMAIAFNVLKSIKLEETPFSAKNVRRLKIMAMLLVAYEPYFLINQEVLRRFNPVILPDGSLVEVRSSLWGVVFVSGLVVYCFSLVFEYGTALQQQIDETL